MAEVPDFSDFYRAVNEGRDPFPWQGRLARRVDEAGWPELIGVPTGLGKTGCIDIAVWALARQARRPASERTAPTRIWYVVNRRLLVDRAFDEGTRLANLLARPRTLRDEWEGSSTDDVAVLEAVADALDRIAFLGAETGPLQIVRLRGGTELGARPPDPSQPAIVFSTVPMFASRWLFRGYGTSASMRPVDAAHAGLDSLVLLDEAHLARPLLRMAQQLADSDLGDPERVINRDRARPQLVSLTATGDESGSRFELDDADTSHPVIRKRLTAAKQTSLVQSSDKALARDLAARATELCAEAEGSPRAVVFCNTPRTAREVANILTRDDAADVVLVTGRMREREAALIRSRVQAPDTGAPSEAAERDPELVPLIVVATQTLEVGADLDFDVLVTEAAGVRALTQRFGRLNRLGNRQRAYAAVVHASDRKSYPIYGEEPFEVWDRLAAAADEDGYVDLSPAVVDEVLGEPEDVPNRTGELLPVHLWEFAKTNPPPPGAAPPELFYEGFGESDRSVSVLWRAHIPMAGVRLTPPVSDTESLDVPIWELRDALEDREVETVWRLAADRAVVEEVTVGRLRPGDEVVLPATIGLYDEHGWNATAAGEVLDVSLLRPGSGLLWMDTSAALALTDREAVDPDSRARIAEALAILEPDDEEDFPDVSETAAAVEGVRAVLRRLRPHPWLEPQEWDGHLDAIGTVCERPLDDLAFVPVTPPARTGPARISVRTEAFDELSFTARSADLVEHLGSVGQTAERIAQHLGLTPDALNAVALAGRFHDLGKFEPRFQSWLDPTGAAGCPVAKSGLPASSWERNRIASGWPRGARHELLSTRMASDVLQSNDRLADLVLHLVASHHGHGRPLVPTVADDAPTKVVARVDGTDIVASGDLSTVDWDQPRRFRMACEEYGIWGVALLEAVVRQADHAVSSIAEVI